MNSNEREAFAALLSDFLTAKLAKRESQVTPAEVLELQRTHRARFPRKGEGVGGEVVTAGVDCSRSVDRQRSVQRAAVNDADSSSAKSSAGKSTAIDTAPATDTAVFLAAPVREVWRYWRRLKDLDRRDPDPEEIEAIEDRLSYGFSVEQLHDYLGRVVADPGCVGLVRVATLCSALRNDRRVCRGLRVPYRKRHNPVKRESWLTAYDVIWRKHYPGGVLPWGLAGKVLRELEARIGRQQALDRFDEYLTDRPMGFVSFPKFASGDFGPFRSSGTRAKPGASMAAEFEAGNYQPEE